MATTGRVRALLAWRDWTLPLKIAAVLALPLVVALAAGTGLLWRGADALGAHRTDERVVQAVRGASSALAAVQDERELVAGQTGGERLTAARAGTDAAVAQLTGALAQVADPGRAAETAQARLARLDEVRAIAVPTQAVAEYSAVTGALLDLHAALLPAIARAEPAHRLSTAHDLARANEHLSQQQSFIALGLAARALPEPQLGQARAATALATAWFGRFSSAASGEAQALLSSTVVATAVDARDQLAAAVLGPDGVFRPSVSAPQWLTVSQPVIDQVGEALARLTDAAVDEVGAHAADAAATQRNLVVGLVAAALLAAAVAFAVLRHVRGAVGALRAAAIDIAGDKLPAALQRARDGRAAERPSMPAPAGGEFGAIAAAFDTVCGEAVQAATEQAKMRSGYAEVFVNMFRRSQSLVQRQLQLVQQLEQEADSPDQLTKLFQLDHLVTRTRRNNENVLVLSGTELVRKTGMPVPVANVIQAAMSEVEQYQRVEAVDPPKAKVVDSAAGDLIRMLAELIDNATAFSAPDTAVTVQAQVLRDGSLSIAVADNGIGMSDEEVRAANERLTRLGSLELATSRRVGLLVVGRLAGRHGFGVELLGGENFPGVTVLVSVPADFVVEAERPGWADRRHAMKAAQLRRAQSDEPTGGTKPRRLVSVGGSDTDTPARTGAATATAVRSSPEERARELVEQAHADVPEELPLRKPNRVIGKAGAVKSPAERAASAWFRARDTAEQPRAVSVAPSARDRERPENWQSVVDDDWNVVETMSRPERYAYTEDGLPMRERGAQLLPGSAGSGAGRRAQPVERDPEHTRLRISSFQRGVQRAKKTSGTRSKRSGGWKAMGRKGDGA
ncbi:sensor histidine kinase [Saccharothrix coeruleofusca]|uniref:histidine kinase n=1 Tax=Saccharothrix coeruleofusca TaxID=33919 RepID=A0A918AP73_9PSEU|nr:nitrate- and nitrite sensing domain-containing protein [Saccharothrix coeruleofusca]MBP2334951.1 signal transduction histidine kinase [Saccharothrix coeruleofusca]GGP68146.1 hypothetical protein GCM10010185_46200 [Saccharothrix coeruleofusca]